MNVVVQKRVTFLDIIQKVDALLDFYKEKAEVLLEISQEIDSLKFRKENKLVSAILFQEKGYWIVKEKKRLSQKYKEQVYILVKQLEMLFHQTEIYFSNLSEERYKVNKSSIEFRVSKVRSSYDQILREFIILEKLNLHEHKVKLNKINTLILEITSNIEIIDNIYNLNTREVNNLDYKKIKKIPSSELEVGDIILFDKGEKNLNFFRKFLRVLLRSNIIHSSLVYKVEKDVIYILEANSFNSRIISIDKLEYEEDFKYIVMRSKKKFNKKQKKLFIELADQTLEEKFNNFKLLSGSFERFLEYIFHNFSIKRKENPLKSIKGTFCSEIVVRLYKKLGVQLGISEDSSMASPVDIYKSHSLEVVGILENERN